MVAVFPLSTRFFATQDLLIPGVLDKLSAKILRVLALPALLRMLNGF